jgi:hypothetical protein
MLLVVAWIDGEAKAVVDEGRSEVPRSWGVKRVAE